MIEWYAGHNLWRVGFHLDALPLINLLSGMVEILESIWIPEEQVLVFIVKNLDETGVLFRNGSLAATPIFKYRQPQQGILAVARTSAFHDLQEVC
jgi:hypothetical protein